MSRQYHQGKFTPKHPHTYIGDATNIVYRSSWEKMFFLYLDGLSGHPNSPIMGWNSEGVVIPYRCPVLDDKPHKYYMDIAFKYRNAQGEIISCLVEIKPYAQTIPPKPSKNQRSYAMQMIDYARNQAKWEAARAFCKENNMEFKIITEYELGLKKWKK
jgi:hypothetical protein